MIKKITFKMFENVTDERVRKIVFEMMDQVLQADDGLYHDQQWQTEQKLKFVWSLFRICMVVCPNMKETLTSIR